MHLSIQPPCRLSLLAGALSVAFAAPAQAQDAPPAATATDDAVQVVMVTAQKRKEKLQEVPIAATALGQRELELRGVSNVADLSSIAPNVTVTHAPGNSTSAQISIRGSVTINPALYWEPTVGMYVDGVYSGKTQGAVMDLVDLERVEVLRGPQGTLYGRNTMAGAINFITRKPSGEFGGSASIDLGNYNARTGKVSLDLPQVGIFRAAVGMRAEKRDGWVKTTPGSIVSELNNRDGKSARVAVDADLSPRIELSYRFDTTRADQNSSLSQLVHSDLAIPGLVVTPPGRQTLASVDGPSMEQMDLDGHSLSAEWKLSDSNTLKYTWAQRELRWEDGLDMDGSPLPVAHIERHSDYRQRSNELQLVGSRGALHYVLGLFAFEDRGATLNPQTYFFTSHYDSRYGFTTDAKSAYGQLDYQLNDRIKLTGGLRYTSEEKTIDRFLAGPGVSVPAGTTGAAKFTSSTPLLSVGYKISEQASVYAKYAEGFKSGGFNGEASDVEETLTPFRPEELKSFEVGLKSTLAGGKATVNLALFENRTSDLQESIFIAEGAAASNIRNAGKAVSRGLELEIGVRPTRDLRLQANYGYLSAHYDEFIDRGENVADNRAMVHAPRHNLNLLIDATLARSSYGTWRALADYSYTAEHYTYPYQLVRVDPTAAVASDSRIAGAGFLNLRLALSGLTVRQTTSEIAFWARNALDKRHVANYIDFGPGFGNMRAAYFAQPRTFGVTLKTSF